MDALLLALQNVCSQLLPIIGAVALVYLCILLKKLCALIDSSTATVKRLDPTIDLVDQSIQKVQAPLDTVVKVSHTVDQVHDKTVDAVSKAATFVNDNVDKMKSAVQKKMDENTFDTIKHEPVQPVPPEAPVNPYPGSSANRMDDPIKKEGE